MSIKVTGLEKLQYVPRLSDIFKCLIMQYDNKVKSKRAAVDLMRTSTEKWR